MVKGSIPWEVAVLVVRMGYSLVYQVYLVGRRLLSELRKRNVAKIDRNLGKPYQSLTNSKFVEKQSIDAVCGEGCFNRITAHICTTIHKDF